MDRADIICYQCAKPWCGTCDMCHYCESVYFKQKGDTSPYNYKTIASLGFSVDPPSTQKGKGVLILKSLGWAVPKLKGFVRTKEDAILHGKDHYPLFARPCPQRPRHGFVDSRVVKNEDELLKVLEETLAADPKGEVMLMTPINAKWNAIWTPTCLSLGEGNDGATAGRDVISIPLVRSSQSISEISLKQAGVKKEEDPYIEIVGSGTSFYYTQLRAGARMGVITKNFIPSPVTVKEIIPTSKDGKEIPLLEWEEIMKQKAKNPSGVVVYHPGGSFTDHFSVHARTFDIPIILEEKELAIGQTLEKESEIVIPDPQAVLKGVIAGEKVPLVCASGLSQYVSFLLVALHHSGAMGGEFGKWLGAGVALMIRFGMSALAGEARHFQPKGKAAMPDRSKIYDKNFPFSLSRHQSRVNRLTNILRYGFSGGGIGGEKWAKCGASVMPLFNCIRLLSRDPSPEVVKEMIRAFNVAVNQAHNNGWWLNKFSSEGEFNSIQQGLIPPIIRASVPAMEIEKLYRAIKPSEMEKRITQWSAWDETKFVPTPVKSAEVINLPSLPGVSIKFKARILGPSYQKEIVIPSEALTPKVNEIIGSFYLVEGENGMRVELRKGKVITPIWEEKALI